MAAHYRLRRWFQNLIRVKQNQRFVFEAGFGPTRQPQPFDESDRP